MLYATQSLRCAVWEGLARDRFARRRRRILAFGEVEPIVVVTLHAIEPLSLVDLRHDGPVRIGAPHRSADSSHPRCDHRAGQSLSAATYANVLEADGFVYQSRFTGHMCMAVFDRAAPKLAVRDVTGLVRHPKFADVLLESVLSAIETLPLAEPTDRRYGEIRTELERIDRPIGHNDLLIAAHAKALGATLVTNNVGEFSRVPDLAVEDWRR